MTKIVKRIGAGDAPGDSQVFSIPDGNQPLKAVIPAKRESTAKLSGKQG